MRCACRKCTDRFPCAIGVFLGVLLLVGGSCVILIWAFMPNFSQTYPIGLQVGAVTCGLGVLVVISALIAVYRWHVKMSRRTTENSNATSACKLGNAHEFYIATPSSFSFTGNESQGRLKKAHSTAYISLGPTQTEKIKVLGLVHGFISATDLRRPLRTSVSLKGSTHSQPSGVFRNSSVVEPSNASAVLFNGGPETGSVALPAHCYKRFTREKCLRRSLPRVLVHPPAKRPIHESHSQTNLAERRSRGNGNEDQGDTVKSALNPTVNCNTTEPGSTSPRLGPEAKHSVSSHHSTREVNFSKMDPDIKPRCHLTRVLTTPPIGRASLFNLTSSECVSPSVWMNAGYGAGSTLNTWSADSNRSKTAHDSRASLDRANSGKRFLLMSQSGQVISCTTLFGEEVEVDTSSTGGVGCRRLQACPGWNFFPVFVGRDQFVSDDELEKPFASVNNGTTTSHSMHVSDACLSFTNSNVDISCTQTDNSDRVLTQNRDPRRSVGPLNWFRRLVKRVRSTNRRRLQNRIMINGPNISTKDVEARLHPSLISAPILNTETLSKNTINHPTEPERSTPPKDDLGADEDSTADLRAPHTPDALNNDSVFSLPAISPDLWTAERPVWIMGVPVTDGEKPDNRWLAKMDKCDVILLREKREGNHPDVVTGSSSSVYAFHVRPPSRLRPGNQALSTRTHGRARSLGRILLSEKQSAKS